MYRKLSKTILIVILFLSPLFSQAGMNIDDVFKLKFVIESSISPDGKFIAYTVLVPKPISDGAGSDYRELHLYNLEKKESTPFIAGKVSIYSLGWSGDSKRITFLSNLGDVKGTQVYSMAVDGGSASPVTNHSRSIGHYEFSSDGEKIFFTSSEPRNEEAKNSFKKKGFDTEVYEEEYDNITLYSLNLKTKKHSALTKDVSVFDFQLSPDNKKIAAVIADKNLVDDSYMFKRIYLMNAESGERKKIVDNPGKLTQVQWSPESKYLAIVSASDITDPVSGSLFVVDTDSPKPFNELRNYVKGMELSVKFVKWFDNKTMLFLSDESVNTSLRMQKIEDEKSKIIYEGTPVVFNSFTMSKKQIAFSGNSREHPSELFTMEIPSAKLNRLTTTNEFLAERKIAKQEKYIYHARDGLRIDGVLIYPLNFTEGKRYPLIAYIHGGPEGCVSNGWMTGYSTWGQVASSRDYFLFAPNYRASSSRGVEFSKMDRGDLVGSEFEDVVDGIDTLIKKGWVDESKVGIGGGSYGGYFSAWGATRYTHRFAAAVAFVGVSNQISKSFTTDIPYEDYYVHWGIWPHENFGLYLDRSPVKYAHTSKTPTLILHGKDDPRVFPAQSLELYRALKTHGKAPVRLIYYPGEGHGNRKNTSRYDYLYRTMEWFDYYLKENHPKDSMPDLYPAMD